MHDTASTITCFHFTNRQEKILVVEDNIVNQRILSKQLKDGGYDCEVANNGQEAIAKLATSNFDLIFMDILMPVMSGVEATKVIRKQEKDLPSMARIPIIALTAYASSESKKETQEAGMDDYLTKPYEKTKLYQIVEKWTVAQPRFSLPPQSTTDITPALNTVPNLVTIPQPIAYIHTEQITTKKPSSSSSSFWSDQQQPSEEEVCRDTIMHKHLIT